MRLGKDEDMLLSVDRVGKISVLIDLFVGSTRVEGSVTISDVLLKKSLT